MQLRLESNLKASPLALDQGSIEQEHTKILLAYLDGKSPDKSNLKYIRDDLLRVHTLRCIYSGMNIRSDQENIVSILNGFYENYSM